MAIPMAQKAFMGMMALFAFVFWLNPNDMILVASFPDIQSNALALQVGRVYLQVVGSFAGMMFFLNCPYPHGQLMAMPILILTFAKHYFIDGLVPPVPVMVIAFIVTFLSIKAVQNHKKGD